MIEKIIEVSKIAGEVIREGYRSGFGIEFKTNESNLVTEIDKKAEAKIIDYIHKNFPGHSVLAEESGSEKNNSEFLWVIDPIDGTTNFAHGLPIFSVSIGVQRVGQTVAGVVYDVMRDVAYAAELGNGAFANERKMLVSNTERLERSLLVTGFPYHVSENPNLVKQRFVHMLDHSRGIRRLGSAAIDFAYVADGIFDGFWEVSLHPWDLCAGKLLVEEAGGKVTNFRGESISIYSEEILASNGLIHTKLCDELMSVK